MMEGRLIYPSHLEKLIEVRERGNKMEKGEMKTKNKQRRKKINQRERWHFSLTNVRGRYYPHADEMLQTQSG